MGRKVKGPTGVMRIAGVATIAVYLTGGIAMVHGGHTVGHYPSYYPDEIRIDVMDPAAAAKSLGDATLHAYVGAVPAFQGGPPKDVKAVKSLGSLLVLNLDPKAKAHASSNGRCAAARAATAALSRQKIVDFVFHPYPVTPYHADYIHHLDRVEEAIEATTLGGGDTPTPKIVAKGRLAEAVVGVHSAASAALTLEEVPLSRLMADAGMQFDGWLGPPWIKEGWFHAYRLLAPGLDKKSTDAVEDIYRRLIRGNYVDLAEQATLERRLIAALTRECRRLVVGYAVRKEYINDAFSEGIENIAHDSLTGLSAPIFPRTVKLKDYPWNGSLHLGQPTHAKAAWNPVAGFSDAAGRLIWQAVADPAVMPFPFNASWTPNRVLFAVTAMRGQSGGVKAPTEALVPEPGSGRFVRAGSHAFASAKVVYDVVASPYLDGSETEMADLVYPFAFLYRWGSGAADKTGEPALGPAFANLRDRLVGLKTLRVESTVKSIAPGFDLVQKTPVIEVYLRDTPGDDHQIAALAPPWSTVPWHLLALMEAAVERRFAAFSKEESERGRVPWLDLVRDPAMLAKLKGLAEEFERTRYRPEALKDFVTAEQAAHRWRSIRAFAEKAGHFLITNGPYRLQAWTEDSVVLKAVREATYPLGFGTFDRYVNPPEAVIREAVGDAKGILVRADADIAVKVARHYETKREPLTRNTAHGLYPVLVVSRYYLVGVGGDVVGAGKMTWEPDHSFRVTLPELLPPGNYAALLGIFLDGNALLPSTRIIRFTVK
jgi:hypothetical protein